MTVDTTEKTVVSSSYEKNPVTASSSLTSDEQFVENYAIMKIEAGEKPFFNVNRKRQYSRRLFDNMFRVAYYDPTLNRISRTWCARLEVVDGVRTIVEIIDKPVSTNIFL